MKFICVAIVFASALAAGCVSQQVRDSNAANLRAATERRNLAAANSSYECTTNEACDKAFRLTKIYVQEHSSMKIQFADDTLISTFNPIRGGDIGISARKVPGKGTTSVIDLTVTCKGAEYDSTGGCQNRQAFIYEGLKAFIDSRMN